MSAAASVRKYHNDPLVVLLCHLLPVTVPIIPLTQSVSPTATEATTPLIPTVQLPLTALLQSVKLLLKVIIWLVRGTDNVDWQSG